MGFLLEPYILKTLKIMYSTPILFIIFNRKATATMTFDAIKRIKPSKLYIASDGARVDVEGEQAKVENTRTSILNMIDWDCEVKTLFQEKNIGCGRGVYTAINWLFENEDCGIILEDDCIASPSFFQYAEDMLFRFKDDQRIGMIAGHNAFPLHDGYHYSIIFSKFKACWGWATWRRAWKNMDIDMNWRKSDFYKSIIDNSGYHAKDSYRWKFELKCIDKNYVSAWDWQWYFSLAAQNQLCIFPKVNLISNIGNGADATHTSFSNVTIPYGELEFPLALPPYLCPYEEFDRTNYTEDWSLKGFLIRNIPPSIKNKIKKLLK